MLYKYETHCHCSQCSACSGSTSLEIAKSYYDAGYSGIVMTDHFIYGNTAVDRSLPWEEQMKLYYKAYTDAKEYMEKYDFDVIFGIEHAYEGGKEMLCYGIDLDFLLSHPNMYDYSIDEFVDAVHSYGGLVFQAHPYRDRKHIDMTVLPRIDIVDGFEVYNACNRGNENKLAFSVAESNGLMMSSGSDTHNCSDSILIGKAGLAFSHRIKDTFEFAEAVKKHEYRLIVNGDVLENPTVDNF